MLRSCRHGYGMDKIKSLNQIQHLHQLRHLHIWHFRGLESLPEWLGNLTSLRVLKLWNLQNLKCLPSYAALRHLTELEISNCPQLEEPCTRGTGAGWPKFQHIPNFTFRQHAADLVSNIFFLDSFLVNLCANYKSWTCKVRI